MRVVTHHSGYFLFAKEPNCQFFAVPYWSPISDYIFTIRYWITNHDIRVDLGLSAHGLLSDKHKHFVTGYHASLPPLFLINPCWIWVTANSLLQSADYARICPVSSSYVETTAKTKINGRERWTKNKQYLKFIAIVPVFSFFHINVLTYLPRCMIHQWASCYPIAQTEMDGWLRRP